ncbi:MAG: hypothetical protein MUC92_07050 [Fimbriimonadaceae bacterium]|jgi:PPK2 family polyphosphate:nucleotide phosphotransferase|nr:hypothetical protein [Fimbriimonadaceae bacterium]
MANHKGFWLTEPSKPELSKLPTLPPKGITKQEALVEMEALGKRLEELLDLLYSAGQKGLLVVLQGMDTSGKDGTIRQILTHSNAQSLKICPFKVPTPLELSHDFLWRVHSQVPAKGNISVFNRSHYEDVLVVRVRNLVPEEKWSRRYDSINHFEELLANNDTIILKFFLHISKEEQKERLLEREQDVTKAWKLNVADWKERAYWDDYQEAYEAALGQCVSEKAPWIVVPSDKKWYRNLVVVHTIVESLERFEKEWLKELNRIGEIAKAELGQIPRE